MAVSVKQYFLSHERCLITGSMMFQKLTEQERLVTKPDGSLIHGKQIAQLIAKDGSATRLQHDDRNSGQNLSGERTHNMFQIFFGPVKHAEIVERPSAAKMNLRDADAETRSLEHLQRCAARVRMKVIVKSIRPQNHLTSWRYYSLVLSGSGNMILPGPLLESGPGELRHAPLGSQMQEALQNVAEARWLAKKVGDAPRNRAELRPAVDHSKGICMQRTRSLFVIVRQEFCLIRRDIHVGRAFRFAGLAGEAQIERAFHMFVLPGVMHHLALQNFKKHMRTAARAVLLLKRNHIARTHRAGIMLAAFSQSDAPNSRLREGAAIIRKLKIRFELQRFIIRPEAQVLRGQVGVDHLIRIHLVVRIPGGLELGKRPDQLGTEHLR